MPQTSLKWDKKGTKRTGEETISDRRRQHLNWKAGGAERRVITDLVNPKKQNLRVSAGAVGNKKQFLRQNFGKM